MDEITNNSMEKLLRDLLGNLRECKFIKLFVVVVLRVDMEESIST